MDELGMISGFRDWLEGERSRLLRAGIRSEILGQTSFVPSSIHATLKTERFEGQVQLWEDGQSEFFFLDWEAADRDPNYQVKVTHYDFEVPGQLQAALEALVDQISPVMA